MKRYFFHLHECGSVIRDEQGSNWRSLEAAQAQACRAAREVMCDELIEGRLCLSCSIEIEDATGATVLSVPFREAVTITGASPPSGSIDHHWD